MRSARNVGEEMTKLSEAAEMCARLANEADISFARSCVGRCVGYLYEALRSADVDAYVYGLSTEHTLELVEAARHRIEHTVCRVADLNGPG